MTSANLEELLNGVRVKLFMSERDIFQSLHTACVIKYTSGQHHKCKKSKEKRKLSISF